MKGGAASPAFVLPYRPPYDFDGLLNFLHDRSIPGIESAIDQAYRRIVRIEKVDTVKTDDDLEKIGWIEVTHRPALHALELCCDEILASELAVVLSRTNQAFDLDTDPAEIDRVLGGADLGHTVCHRVRNADFNPIRRTESGVSLCRLRGGPGPVRNCEPGDCASARRGNHQPCQRNEFGRN